jgi:hypothetical protein
MIHIANGIEPDPGSDPRSSSRGDADMKWLVRNRTAVGLVVAALAVTSLTGTSFAGGHHRRGFVVIGAPTYIYPAPVVYAAPAPVVVYPSPVVVYPSPVVVYRPSPLFFFGGHHWGFRFHW